jgi:hypothetical protein
MRSQYVALACAALLALSGCEEERVTGTVAEPLVGPRVAESLLALNVEDGIPIGITDVFRLDEYVNLWVHWESLDPPHTVEVVWYDPAFSSFATDLELEARAPEQVTVFTLELTGLSATGRWEVEVYLDGEFMRSHAFLVVDQLPGEP